MLAPADKASALFSQVELQFSQAAAKSCISRRTMRLAGQTVTLEFAGDALIDRLMPALEHLEVAECASDEESDLIVRLWDRKSTDIPAPPFPWQHDQLGKRREIRDASTDEFRLSYDLFCGVLSLVSLERCRAYWWIDDADNLPAYESAAPLREILQAWFEARGGTFLHAAAIGTRSGAALLVGKGGSGKSTTSVASVKGDLAYMGDDYCLLTEGAQGEYAVHCLYASAKLNAPSLQMANCLNRLAINPERCPLQDKAILMLAGHVPIINDAPVKTIILPVQADRDDTQFENARPMEALMALAPSTVLQLSEAGQGALNIMKQLAQSVPAYRLHLKAGQADASVVIQQILAEAA